MQPSESGLEVPVIVTASPRVGLADAWSTAWPPCAGAKRLTSPQPPLPAAPLGPDFSLLFFSQVLIVHTNHLTSLLPKSCSLLSLATIKVLGPL